MKTEQRAERLRNGILSAGMWVFLGSIPVLLVLSFLGKYPNPIAGVLPLLGIILIFASVGFYDIWALVTRRYRRPDETVAKDPEEKREAEQSLASLIVVGRGLTFSGAAIYVLYQAIKASV